MKMKLDIFEDFFFFFGILQTHDTHKKKLKKKLGSENNKSQVIFSVYGYIKFKVMCG